MTTERVLPIFTWPKFQPEEMLGDPTAKLCVIGGAAANVGFPAWLAWIVQVPGAISSAVDPVTVQTVGVFEIKATGRPELDVAVNGSGMLAPTSGTTAVTGEKAIVWVAALTVKL